MYSKWSSHLPKEEQDRFQNIVRHSSQVLERLKDIIEEAEQQLENSELTIEAYNNPSWSHKQAHKNGLKQAYRNIKKIITLDQKEQ